MGPTHGLHWSYYVSPYPPEAFLIEQRNSVLNWKFVFLPKVYVGMPRSPCDGIRKLGPCVVSMTFEYETSHECRAFVMGLVPSGRDSWELAFFVTALSWVRIQQEDHQWKTRNQALVRQGVYLDLGPAILQNFVKEMFVVSTIHSMVIVTAAIENSPMTPAKWQYLEKFGSYLLDLILCWSRGLGSKEESASTWEHDKDSTNNRVRLAMHLELRPLNLEAKKRNWLCRLGD